MRKVAFLAFCLASFLARAPLACALNLEKFDRLVVFGDSLSDNGNLFAITHGEQPPFPPYGETFDEKTGPFPGRFTDGQNWVDYFPSVARHFAQVTAFYSDPNNGTNFAIGGSTSEDLTKQIDAYLNSPAGQNPAKNLCVIWIGGNDFFNAPPILPNVTVENICDGITRLWNAGVRSFAVIKVPDISLTPRIMGKPTIIQPAKQFVFAVNVLLEVELPLFAWLHRIHVQLVDINQIFIQLVLEPGRFGFTNSTTPALAALVANPNTNPNGYIFFDDFHATTRAYFLAAEFIYRSIAFRRDFPVNLQITRYSR